jgi:hypothetical protein
VTGGFIPLFNIAALRARGDADLSSALDRGSETMYGGLGVSDFDLENLSIAFAIASFAMDLIKEETC